VEAQETDVIIAERPGFSSSPFTLAPTVMQIETGYRYLRDGNGVDVDDHTLPLMLIRYGLADTVELQFGWAGYSWTEVGSQRIDGVNDASIGVKWQITDADAVVPVALFAAVSLPVGDDDFTSDEVDPSVGAFWSYSANLDWFGTVIVSESDDDSSISNAVGISLPIADETGAYVEYFGNYGASGGPEHYLNGGVTYIPRNDMQFDVHAGVGLNDRSADYFIGLGLAFRF
jgi:hypothetical protein